MSRSSRRRTTLLGAGAVLVGGVFGLTACDRYDPTVTVTLSESGSDLVVSGTIDDVDGRNARSYSSLIVTVDGVEVQRVEFLMGGTYRYEVTIGRPANGAQVCVLSTGVASRDTDFPAFRSGTACASFGSKDASTTTTTSTTSTSTTTTSTTTTTTAPPATVPDTTLSCGAPSC